MGDTGAAVVVGLTAPDRFPSCRRTTIVGSEPDDGRGPAVNPDQTGVRRGQRPNRPGGPMIIATTNDLPGYVIERLIGEVFGLTVRSRNIGSQLGASLKSLVGGELRGMTTMLSDGRQQAIQRLIEEATQLGGNAILAMRFDTSELGSTWTEICAYGTAVVVRPA
jgi:uncharacterized protein YbjQ (UPF0145 family)